MREHRDEQGCRLAVGWIRGKRNLDPVLAAEKMKPMRRDQMLTHEVTHRYSGNGFAVVEILPPTKSSLTGKTTEYVRVTDKYCQFGQAFLAAVDHLDVFSLSPGKDPVKLTKEELENLRPLREGIASGALKVICTRFVKQQPVTV